jgi:hypothetical protein
MADPNLKIAPALFSTGFFYVVGNLFVVKVVSV